jgi:FixJ family two-component response regulator
MAEGATIHLVDDDSALRRSLGRLLATAGRKVVTHASAAEFFEQFDPDVAGCLVLDRKMPGADGHAVQTWLRERRACLPIIFLTAEGDIPSSVRAMRDGAVDYLTKPIAAAALLASVDRALGLDRERRARRAEADAHSRRLASLTQREREVLDAAVAGRLNKQIAGDLGIVEKTVKVHRARAMKKMGAGTFADLVTMVVRHRDDG